MRKFDLLRKGDSIVRVLEVQPDKILVINCIKKSMPFWMESTQLCSYLPCTEGELAEATGVEIPEENQLSACQRKIMRERYTMIAPILPFLSVKEMRSQWIRTMALQGNVSKQTIRSYLYLYLAYMDMSVLAPKLRDTSLNPTPDEKNMRWALNKFFYTPQKQSLMTVYTMMLEEKYCDQSGGLLENYPSFYQFRYFYRKTRKLQNYYISRKGLKCYQRENRPLVGGGVRQFAPAVGVGMLDATICDIYLVNEAGQLVGRSILTACVDTYSSLCCGYFLSWEGGVYSLKGLMINIITDKAVWCKKFGIEISEDTWPCRGLPGTLVTDKGTEFTSETFGQIAELGVKIVNLPSYRPELKGPIEKFFDIIQSAYKKHLKGKGVIEPDFQERGAHPYQKDACLTMSDFEKILLHCILYYNSQRIVNGFPFIKAINGEEVKPYANSIWNWGVSQMGANLIKVEEQELVLTLLPRTTGKFSRYGLKVNRLHYHCEGFTEQYLNGGRGIVAYNPENIEAVWLVDQGAYIRFSLIESGYQGMDLTAVEHIKASQRMRSQNMEPGQLQAQIDLARHINAIVKTVPKHEEVRMKNVRETRKQEQALRHKDYLKGEDHE